MSNYKIRLFDDMGHLNYQSNLSKEIEKKYIEKYITII